MTIHLLQLLCVEMSEVQKKGKNLSVCNATNGAAVEGPL